MHKILYVDESAIAIKRAQRLLGESYDLDCAAEMQEALVLIASNEYEMFLLDQSSKVSFGLKLAKMIRGMETYSHTPIMLLSSALTNRLAYAALRAGVNKSLNKLLSAEDLAREVQALLEEPTTEEVTLEHLETKCVKWCDDNVFYQYSPEFGISISGVTEEDAYEKMKAALLEAYQRSGDLGVFPDDIELSSFSVSLK